MPELGEIFAGRGVGAHRGWPRLEVDGAGWTVAGEALGQGRLPLLGLWRRHCRLGDCARGLHRQ